MDFIDALLGERGRQWLRRLVDLICGLILLGLAYRVYIKAGKISGYGDMTDILHVPVGPFVYLMALMVLLTAIVHIVKAFLPSPEKAQGFDPDKASTT